jgi:erythromycin esterase
MGEHLDKQLKDKYVNIGFAFHNGNYTAWGPKKLGTYKAQSSYAGTYEYYFKAINEPIFALDLRNIPKDNPAAQWLLKQLEFRHIGSTKMESDFSKTDLTKDFDIVIFINNSSPSVLLKR